MGHEKRILDAFNTNGIERILLIDDAFDPPTLSADALGPLVDFLESPAGQAAGGEAGLTADQMQAALDAALNGAADDDAVVGARAALFRMFASSADAKFDPDGAFARAKGVTLGVLAPLIALLRKCDTADLRFAGLNDALEVFRAFEPHVVFLDYFLAPDIPVTGAASPSAKGKAKKASIDLLVRMLRLPEIKTPAVILMSSREMKDQADDFRRSVDKDAESQVMALRFRFLQKNWVTQDGTVLKIANDAADALLDTTQGFEFGSVLQQALVKWRTGAREAMNAFLDEIGGLEPKDFAYLFRFRLLTEGQRMSDYLEWMFGESLKAMVDETVEWADDSFEKLDDGKLSGSIEGAFEGPSTRIARIFDRIRVNHHKVRAVTRYQLGDVYILAGGTEARVVITPDCDLVPRKGGPNAQTVLTMGGKLQSFDKENTSADQFVFPGDKPYSVKWNPKDLRSLPFDGAGSLRDDPAFTYYGTLRPIYAQEVQRTALTDLSRVGLAVAPVMGVDAAVSVHLRIKAEGGGTAYVKVPVTKAAKATILLARGEGRDGHTVLFRRSFVHALLDALRGQDQVKMETADAAALKQFLHESNEGSLIKGLLSAGSAAKKSEKGPMGVRIAIGSNPDLKPHNAWMHVMLQLSKVAMAELLTVDPTLQPDDATAAAA
jgi:hypothetical protein